MTKPVDCDRLWHGARLASMTAGGLGIVEDGLVAARDGRIVWAGAAERAPALTASETIDCGGRWITPGLIDCHTHLVYAGNRTNEFAMRLAGADYAAIARAGGGILSTMRATRAASELELVGSALPRLDSLIAEGVTTVEIKSGYGLSPIDEMKMLRAARRLGNERHVSVSTTFLGAHAVPPEFAGRSDDYVDLLCDVMIPAAASAGLADAVDGFCESIAFTPAQIDRVFAAAAKAGLPVKLHAEQLSDSGGAALAAQHRALSADHLEHVSDAGIAAMAASGTVAVLLPGAFYFLRETRKPPVEKLRAAGVPIAIATDCNPGTSPLASPLVTMNFGAVLFGLTPAEALAGMTINAARALGLHELTGSLEAGKWCDLAIWDIDTPEELVCRIGPNPLWQRIRRGR